MTWQRDTLTEDLVVSPQWACTKNTWIHIDTCMSTRDVWKLHILSTRATGSAGLRAKDVIPWQKMFWTGTWHDNYYPAWECTADQVCPGFCSWPALCPKGKKYAFWTKTCPISKPCSFDIQISFCHNSRAFTKAAFSLELVSEPAHFISSELQLHPLHYNYMARWTGQFECTEGLKVSGEPLH